MFREELSKGFLKLLEERGVASELARVVEKNPSFINGVKRGNPVNALHLKAVGIVFGAEKVLELLALDQNAMKAGPTFRDQKCGNEIVKQMVELEKNSPKAFEMVKTYVNGAYEASKAAAQQWEEIEKGPPKKKDEGLNLQRRGNGE